VLRQSARYPGAPILWFYIMLATSRHVLIVARYWPRMLRAASVPDASWLPAAPLLCPFAHWPFGLTEISFGQATPCCERGTSRPLTKISSPGP
jgi:hypothetical protein